MPLPRAQCGAQVLVARVQAPAGPHARLARIGQPSTVSPIPRVGVEGALAPALHQRRVGLDAVDALAPEHAAHVALVHLQGRSAPLRHDPGHHPRHAVGHGSGQVAHGRTQAPVGEVLGQGAPARHGFVGHDGRGRAWVRRQAASDGGSDATRAAGVAAGGAAALAQRAARAAAQRLLPPGPPAADRRAGRPGEITPGHTGGLTRFTPGAPARVHAALTPGLNAAPDDGVASGGLVPDLDEACDRGERDEHEEDPEDRHEDDAAQEGDAEQEHALAALHEAAPRRETERLRLGSLVGNQRGHRQDGHGQ